MRSYIDKSFIVAAGFAATVAIVSCLACAGPAQVDTTTDDEVLTAEQCIDNNTPGSVEPFEKALVREGIVNADFDKISMTRGMCEDIIERTPGGSPIARAAAVGNLTQELQIIKETMENVADGDVNGDGSDNVEDRRIADSASYAASHAAQETVRRAAEEGSTDGGVIGALSAVPAAYLAQKQTTSVPSEQTTSVPGEQTSSVPSEQTTSAAPASATASATATASAGGARPSRVKVRTNASRAAREKGAGPEAAAAAGECATTVKFIDHVTGHVIRGYRTFDAPAKEMHWRDDDRAQLSVASKASLLIEQLKQKLNQAEGAGARCMQLGDQMEAHFIPSNDGLDITSLGKPKKYVRGNASTTWRWHIVASETGRHPLNLNVTAYVDTPSEEGRLRSLEQDPPMFDDYINVSATSWEVFTAFVARRWPVLVPIFLTILTAIIIPFVLPWWRRRNQPSQTRNRSSEPDDQR